MHRKMSGNNWYISSAGQMVARRSAVVRPVQDMTPVFLTQGVE